MSGSTFSNSTYSVQAFVNPGKSSPPSSAPHSRAPHSHTSGASAVVPLSPIIPPSPAYDPAEAAAMAALASGSPASLMSEAECEGRAAVVEEGPRMSGGAVYVALPCADTREELLFTQVSEPSHTHKLCPSKGSSTPPES
jgi:hypothetical protein